MIPLDSTDWIRFQHAYGSAEDIPALVRRLRDFPDDSDPNAEPWHSLWSALCHQGDVYPASFAALPHIVEALHSAPERATFSYFLLPASIEIARNERDVDIPPELERAYFKALNMLPALAAQTIAAMPPSPELCSSALAASAAASGNIAIAALLTELDPGDIDGMREWILER
ncbi:hypothetical protein [Pseudoxanthomonas sp. JBR18]|uniref:hypothetical protein n=1 Tax=Pseudoxanthomonas sp. JBR18 TaxID=2969308 RepID=UPI0023069A83|nr:hypothetical protein [Pseudoxanthomonas sp. JBR18]WCE04046.1 hypothetical protein PJ250_18540 [Pseudoxanthomonas sp. JBR18]